MNALTCSSMWGHQNLYCIAANVFFLPKCPPSNVSCSSVMINLRKPPVDGNTSRSPVEDPRYNNSNPPTVLILNKESADLACYNSNCISSSEVSNYLRCTFASHAGSTTNVLKRDKASGAVPSFPGLYLYSTENYSKNSIQRTYLGLRSR